MHGRLLAMLVLATACGGSRDTPPLDDGDDVDAADMPTDVLTPDIASDDGPILGVTTGDLVVFKGIPYAHADRWMPPVRPAAWSAPLDVGAYGPACPQAHPELPQSEDCLSLNVWAHAGPRASRPVIVFIHGGGFVEGSSRLELYDGASLARGADAIVVTINYRLGVLGYLAMTELASPDGGIGNFGLRDQIAALEWVHRNIAAFGGDPAHVFVTGESAGGASVCQLLASPKATGLYSAASIQSGPCRAALSLTQPTGTFPPTETFGREVVARPLGCTAGDVAACLRSKTVEQILALHLPSYVDIGVPVTSLFPVVDGVVMPERPFAALPHVTVPIVIGSNREDAGAFTYTGGDTPGSFDAYVTSIGHAALRPQLDALYPTATMGELGAIVTLSTDLAFACNVLIAAVLHGAGPTYAYELVRGVPNGPLQFLHATHGVDIIYTLGTFTAWGITPGPDDLALLARMQSMWGQHARGEAPTGWAATPGYSQIDVTSTPGTVWRGNRCTSLAQLGLLGN